MKIKPSQVPPNKEERLLSDIVYHLAWEYTKMRIACDEGFNYQPSKKTRSLNRDCWKILRSVFKKEDQHKARIWVRDYAKNMGWIP